MTAYSTASTSMHQKPASASRQAPSSACGRACSSPDGNCAVCTGTGAYEMAMQPFHKLRATAASRRVATTVECGPSPGKGQGEILASRTQAPPPIGPGDC